MHKEKNSLCKVWEQGYNSFTNFHFYFCLHFDRSSEWQWYAKKQKYIYIFQKLIFGKFSGIGSIKSENNNPDSEDEDDEELMNDNSNEVNNEEEHNESEWVWIQGFWSQNVFTVTVLKNTRRI